ncbi:MAG: hypothetical protein ACKO37_00705 [Vampirovibrionales bacterium]
MRLSSVTSSLTPAMIPETERFGRTASKQESKAIVRILNQHEEEMFRANKLKALSEVASKKDTHTFTSHDKGLGDYLDSDFHLAHSKETFLFKTSAPQKNHFLTIGQLFFDQTLTGTQVAIASAFGKQKSVYTLWKHTSPEALKSLAAFHHQTPLEERSLFYQTHQVFADKDRPDRAVTVSKYHFNPQFKLFSSVHQGKHPFQRILDLSFHKEAITLQQQTLEKKLNTPEDPTADALKAWLTTTEESFPKESAAWTPRKAWSYNAIQAVFHKDAMPQESYYHHVKERSMKEASHT